MNKMLSLLIAATFLLSCGKDYVKINEEEIQEYLSDNNLVTEQTSQGIHYTIETEGTGARPDGNSSVRVHYEGYYLDGEKFDSSYDRGMPAEFPLSGVISGWRVGIPLFKEGGSGTLIIPAAQGYGSNPPTGIRPNAVLVFDIELLKVL